MYVCWLQIQILYIEIFIDLYIWMDSYVRIISLLWQKRAQKHQYSRKLSKVRIKVSGAKAIFQQRQKIILGRNDWMTHFKFNSITKLKIKYEKRVILCKYKYKWFQRGNYINIWKTQLQSKENYQGRSLHNENKNISPQRSNDSRCVHTKQQSLRIHALKTVGHKGSNWYIYAYYKTMLVVSDFNDLLLAML